MPIAYQLHIKPQTLGEKGLPKHKVPSLTVTLTGAEGDYNAYRMRKNPNDADKALLLLPIETLDDLQREGWRVQPGDLGENITTRGIVYTSFAVGQRHRIGSVTLQLTKQATPCANLAVLPQVGQDKLTEFMNALKNRRGWYAKVLTPGTIITNETIQQIT